MYQSSYRKNRIIIFQGDDYSYNTVSYVFSGKAFTSACRGHFSMDEAVNILLYADALELYIPHSIVSDSEIHLEIEESLTDT